MPTLLPPPRGRQLSLTQTPRFLFLVARVRLLDARLAALYLRAERRDREPHGPTLLRLVRRWLAIHEEIGAMLPGIAEPLHVRQVRAVLRILE